MAGHARLELPATAESPGSARRFVTEQLDHWGYRTLVSDAALLTSELVTNAVVHGSEPYAVEVVDLLNGVLVTVEDAGHAALPSAQLPEPAAAGGRGLALVGSIATSWGASAIPSDGTVVWFRLSSPRADLDTDAARPT